MLIYAIDPGPTESAFVAYDGSQILDHFKAENQLVRERLRERSVHGHGDPVLVVEQIASMGMPVGDDVFETVRWAGRFEEVWGRQFDRIKRHAIKMHLCGNMRAKDANIRQALLDRFGGRLAVGIRARPGPLYGISGDQWSALAVAVTWADTRGSLSQ